MQHVAIYVRVSTRRQDTKSQEPDLKRWVDAFVNGTPATWYCDKATGKSMDRPAWQRLEADVEAGKISTVVVWRLDRLGRTASGLTALFDRLRARKVGLVSLKDGLDLETPAGRLMANVLASVAAYETEIRAERILAGQEAARAAGKRWGGSKPGRRIKVTREQATTIYKLHAESTPIAAIARAVGLSRPTVYSIVRGRGCQ
jgi:DNA invertase Pin-like site-specific DNA recombinase